MAGRTRVLVRDLVRWAKELGLSAERLEDEFSRIVATTQGVVVAEARTGAKVFTGALAGSVYGDGPTIQRTPAFLRVSSIVSSRQPYSAPVEEGRAPGETAPPIEPIQRWVELMVRRGKIDVSWAGRDEEKAVRRVAFFVARSISRKGIDPAPFLGPASKIGERVLERELASAVDDFARRAEGGA